MAFLGRNDSPIRLPATEFATYDWDAFNFELLADKYMSKVPTVFRLVRFLCGCSSPEDIDNDPALADAEPDDFDAEPQDDSLILERGVRAQQAGLPLETPEQRKQRKGKDRMRVATTVMGTITFSRSRRANILQTTLGFFAYSSRTPKRVIAVLNRLGITCSYETILEALWASAVGVKKNIVS